MALPSITLGYPGFGLGGGIYGPNPVAMAQMGSFYSPATQTALRRSEYLADALRQLNSEGGQNMKGGWGELGAKLLANAILMRSTDKAQGALLQAMGADRQNQLQTAISGIPGVLGSSPAQASAGAPEQAPELPPPPAPEPTQQTPPAQRPDQQQAASLDPRQFFKDFILPHEGGLNPHDLNGSPTNYGINQAAHPEVDVTKLTPDQAGDIFTNDYFAKYGANKLPPGLAAAYGDTLFINPQRAQQFLQASGGDPQKFLQLRSDWLTNLAAHNPGAAKYGPAWTKRNADLAAYVGSLGPGMAATPIATPVPPGALAGGGDPQHPPAAPALPGGGSLAYAPPGAGAPVPQGVRAAGAPQPVQPTAIPHNYVAPEEWANAVAMTQNPWTFQQGLEKIYELRARAAAPVEAPKDMYWDQAQGRFVPKPGTTFSQTPGPLPGTEIQRDAFGKQDVLTVPNMTNAPPPGYDRDPRDPTKLILQGAAGQPAAASGPGAAQHGGAPSVTPLPPALQKPYMDLLDAWHKAPGYQDYANSVNAANALEANLRAAVGNNGVVSQATTDNLIRAMTGLSARQGSVNSMLEHLPWSEQLKGFISKAIGPENMSGFVTPKVIQQMRTAIHAYAEGHRSLAEQELGQYESAANRMGFSLGQNLPAITAAGPIKWLDEAQPGAAPSKIDGSSPQAAFQPQSQADFDALPVGSWFRNPADGRVLRKAR